MSRFAGEFSGSALRRQRYLAGLTQRSLAELVGTTDSVIARWEAGIHHPTPASLHKLTRALGVDVADLTDERDASLASMRLRHGWTQTQLARATGVSDMTISRLERGITALSPATAAKLADTLLIPLDELLAAHARSQAKGRARKIAPRGYGPDPPNSEPEQLAASTPGSIS